MALVERPWCYQMNVLISFQDDSSLQSIHHSLGLFQLYNRWRQKEKSQRTVTLQQTCRLFGWRRRCRTNRQAELWTCQQKQKTLLFLMSLALLPDTAVWAWLRVHSPPAVHWSSKCNQPARTQLPTVPLESLQKQNETVTHSWGSSTVKCSPQ